MAGGARASIPGQGSARLPTRRSPGRTCLVPAVVVKVVQLVAALLGHHDQNETHSPVRTHEAPPTSHTPPKFTQKVAEPLPVAQGRPSKPPPVQIPPHQTGSASKQGESSGKVPPKQVPPQSASVSHMVPGGTTPPTQTMQPGTPSQEPGTVPEHVPDCGVSQNGLQLETTVPLAPSRHSSSCDRHRPSPLQLPAASATA